MNERITGTVVKLLHSNTIISGGFISAAGEDFYLPARTAQSLSIEEGQHVSFVPSPARDNGRRAVATQVEIESEVVS